MRRLFLHRGDWIPKEVFYWMSLSLSGGVVCPELRDLEWKADYNTLPFHRLLLSPKLEALSLTYSHIRSESPERVLSTLRSVVMGLDTFHLRRLRLHWWISGEAGEEMASAASSAALRCGPALEKSWTFPPLSDAAVQHTMHLPNLSTWDTVSGPPRTPNLTLSQFVRKREGFLFSNLSQDNNG